MEEWFFLCQRLLNRFKSDSRCPGIPYGARNRNLGEFRCFFDVLGRFCHKIVSIFLLSLFTPRHPMPAWNTPTPLDRYWTTSPRLSNCRQTSWSDQMDLSEPPVINRKWHFIIFYRFLTFIAPYLFGIIAELCQNYFFFTFYCCRWVSGKVLCAPGHIPRG